LPIIGAKSPKPAQSGQQPVSPTDCRPIHVSNYDREGRDHYATPAWVTEALLQHVNFRGPIWEPCCGTGAISTVLTTHGYEVVSTDIADYGFGTPGVDFLACRSVRDGCHSIITNPPYGEAATDAGQPRSSKAMLEFLRHALALTATVEGQLALLVRLQWIAGKRVAEVMTAAPFAAVVVLTRRVRWFDKGEQTNNGQHHHAWVVFDHAHPPGQPPALLYA
jgi:predicted RNA methylase